MRKWGIVVTGFYTFVILVLLTPLALGLAAESSSRFFKTLFNSPGTIFGGQSGELAIARQRTGTAGGCAVPRLGAPPRRLLGSRRDGMWHRHRTGSHAAGVRSRSAAAVQETPRFLQRQRQSSRALAAPSW